MTDHPETMISDRGRTLRRGVRPLTVTYKGLSKTVDMPGWYPEDADDDDDAVFVGSDMDASDAALRELKERTTKSRDRKPFGASGKSWVCRNGRPAPCWAAGQTRSRNMKAPRRSQVRPWGSCCSCWTSIPICSRTFRPLWRPETPAPPHQSSPPPLRSRRPRSSWARRSALCSDSARCRARWPRSARWLRGSISAVVTSSVCDAAKISRPARKSGPGRPSGRTRWERRWPPPPADGRTGTSRPDVRRRGPAPA